MGLFDVDPKVWADYKEKIQADARSKVPEEVVIAAPFRRGGAAAKMASSYAQLGGLTYGAISLFNKKKAGGLPERTMLIVTPTKVHAFKYKIKGRGMPITGDELAVWDRGAIRVSTEQKMGVTMLTIESPAEGAQVTLAPAGIKDDPVGQELIAELQATATS
jgi:hypothetical protein